MLTEGEAILMGDIVLTQSSVQVWVRNISEDVLNSIASKAKLDVKVLCPATEA